MFMFVSIATLLARTRASTFAEQQTKAVLQMQASGFSYSVSNNNCISLFLSTGSYSCGVCGRTQTLIKVYLAVWTRNIHHHAVTR